MDENNTPSHPVSQSDVTQTANGSTAQIAQDPSVQPQQQDDSETTVRYLTKESPGETVVSPEFRQFFEGMFEEVLTAPETKAASSQESTDAEIKEIEQQLEHIEEHPDPVTPVVVAEPAQQTDPTIAGMTYTQAMQQSKKITGKSIFSSLSWLATLVTKVFKARQAKEMKL